MKKIKSYKRALLCTILLLSAVFVLINVVSYINHGFIFANSNITGSVVNVKSYGAKLDGKHFDDKALKEAISSIEEGTIYIPKGTLLIPDDVTITVPEGINITGEDFNKTTIKQSSGYPSNKIFSAQGNQKIRDLTIDSELGIKPSGDNIDLYKCKFINGTQSIQVADTVINLKVRHCVFKDNSGYSILFNKKPSYDILISDCEFDRTESDFLEINSTCVGVKIENCTFKNNYCKGQWAGFGIGIAVKAKKVVIDNCSFANINGQGIHVEDEAQVSITDCDFRNCGNVEYEGSPKSDIAVLSRAKVEISKATHYAPRRKYSEIPVYCTGAVAMARDSTYYQRSPSFGLSMSKK